MHYLPKNRLKYSNLRRVIILVLIFISGAIIFSFIDEMAISLLSPIWRVKNTIIIGNETPSISQEQIQKNILLELVGRKPESNMVVATVLTHPPQTPYDVIIIDAGSNEFVTVGSQVSLPEGPVLGLVSEVFSKSAKVRLFSASGEETNAILERNNIPIILTGVGGGNFRLALPRDIAIENGDRILSPDITARHLATVGRISAEPTDSFKEVLAKSPTNIFTLRFVFVTP